MQDTVTTGGENNEGNQENGQGIGAFLYYRGGGKKSLIHQLAKTRRIVLSVPPETWEIVIALADRYTATTSVIVRAAMSIMLRAFVERGTNDKVIAAAIAAAKERFEKAKEARKTGAPLDRLAYARHDLSIDKNMMLAIESIARENGIAGKHFASEYLTLYAYEMYNNLPVADQTLAPFILGRPGPLAAVQKAIAEVLRVHKDDVIIVSTHNDRSYGSQATRALVEEVRRAFPNNPVIYLPKFGQITVARQGDVRIEEIE